MSKINDRFYLMHGRYPDKIKKVKFNIPNGEIIEIGDLLAVEYLATIPKSSNPRTRKGR